MAGQQKYKYLPIFNPDGRLLQVEYCINAIKASKTSTIVLKTNNFAILLSQKSSTETLADQTKHKNIHKITDEILCSLTGLSHDCRHFLTIVRSFAYDFEHNFGYSIPVEYLTNKIAKFTQQLSQYNSVRNLAVSAFLIALPKEIKDTPSAYICMPAGRITPVLAQTVGNNYEKGRAVVEKELASLANETQINRVIKVGLNSMAEMMGKSITGREIDMAVFSKNENENKGILNEKEIIDLVKICYENEEI